MAKYVWYTMNRYVTSSKFPLIQKLQTRLSMEPSLPFPSAFILEHTMAHKPLTLHFLRNILSVPTHHAFLLHWAGNSYILGQQSFQTASQPLFAVSGYHIYFCVIFANIGSHLFLGILPTREIWPSVLSQCHSLVVCFLLLGRSWLLLELKSSH